MIKYASGMITIVATSAPILAYRKGFGSEKLSSRVAVPVKINSATDRP